MSITLKAKKPKKSGVQKIQKYLEEGRSLTALEAMSNFGIFRLASAIEVLRKRGMNIVTDMKTDPNGKTYARYTLVKGQPVPAAAPAVPRVLALAPQRELKVGDEVVVKSFGANPTHNFIGKKGVITATDTAPWPIRVKLEGVPHVQYVKHHELELVAPKKELKVGARVHTTAFTPDGEEATVESPYVGDYGFEWNIRCDGDKFLVPVKASELEVL